MSGDDPAGDGPDVPTEPMPVQVHTLGDGRYELGGVLGAGGMGIVRRATDTVLHREVAIKLLADNLAADPEARQRFLHEGRAVARVADPHVVAVHDVGEDGGRPYLVLELVDGPSLATELRRQGRLDPDDVVAVAAQALAGLAAAHRAGVLHRDVKPGNLLRTNDGDVKVVDFGVAQAADAPGLTRTGFVIGTRSYLAPERRRGAPASVATDLYALGATLVELLTGSPPSTEPEDDPLAGLPDAVPAGLQRLLGRLLEASPSARPDSAEEALFELVEGHPGTEASARASVGDTDAATIGGDTVAYEASTDQSAGRVPRRPGVTGTASGGSGPGAARPGPVPPRDRSRHFLDHGWRIVLLVGLALFAIGIMLRLSAGDDAPAAPEEDTATEDGALELTDETRDLARWLRERAED
ncbi:MAG TPA: serine/threonine-protein kinase [Egicoccus sp.]|nr:serine/threonine-protein kinase [Egicoccus sp.]HSK24736.1 serine/threonine-protein kinase [Egicoccus sp.]